METTQNKVVLVRAEIFRLAKEAPDLETMHWYTSLDEGFENDELQVDELANIRWRATVLSWKHEPINKLLWLIDTCVKSHGYDLMNTYGEEWKRATETSSSITTKP